MAATAAAEFAHFTIDRSADACLHYVVSRNAFHSNTLVQCEAYDMCVYGRGGLVPITM